MREIDWVKERAHHGQVVRDTGRWVGLLDENFVPLADLPELSSMVWPGVRGTINSVTTQVRVRTESGRMHAVVAELVAQNLGKVDEVGRLVPVTGPARLLRMESPELKPRTMRITHTVAEGDALSPHTLTIHGVDLMGYLDMLPCPSNPLTWKNEFTRFERDWVGPEGAKELFAQPRDLTSTKMITVADGASVDGQADQVIYRLVSESIAAVHRVAGLASDGPYAVVLEPARGPSPRLILRPTDQSIWQEVSEAALASGVSIRSDLWWPGDPQPTGLALKYPTVVFTIRQEA